MVKKLLKLSLYGFGGLLLLLIVGMLIFSSENQTPEIETRNIHATCPADKYLLIPGDFDETGWVKAPTPNEKEMLKDMAVKVNVSGYSCYAIGSFGNTKDTATYKYIIYIFPTTQDAETVYNEISTKYKETYSVEELNIGDKSFKWELEGEISKRVDYWILKDNVLIGIWAGGSYFANFDEFAKKTVEKLIRVEQNQ